MLWLACAAAPTDPFTFEEFQASDGTHIPYRLLAAAADDPVVVVLHGSGAIGTDNRAQLGILATSWATPDLRRDYPAWVVVPQFPARSATYAPGTDGVLVSRPTPTLDAVLELVADIAGRGDRRRVYAVGFSMGGSSAWWAALRRPELFAAIVPIGAVAPDVAEVARFPAVPVWAVHGDADTENPIAADRAFVAALGRADVRLREVSGLDHRIPEDLPAARDWRDWMLARHR